jgi:glutamate racemase
LLKNIIQKVVGNSVKLVDSAESLAFELKTLLEQGELLNKDKVGEDHIYVTDLPANFEGVAKRFLSGNLPVVKRVEL